MALSSPGPAEENPGGRSCSPNTNLGKHHGGQLKNMHKTPPANGKAVLNPFTVVLGTTKEDPATAMNMMGPPLVTPNFSASRRGIMVRR